MSVGQDLLDVPFTEMVQKLGLAIAEAQYAVDTTSMRLAQMMSGKYEVEEPDPNDPESTVLVEKEAYVTFDGKKLSLLELGFTPTFYQFVDTIIEVKMSISMSRSIERKTSKKSKSAAVGVAIFPFGGGAAAKSTSVSASYASKYQYSAEGSSLLRTKLVNVPPPAVLEERIRAVMEREAAARESK